MSEEDEYELLPHEEVEQLRKDVNHLKKNPFGEGKDSQDLIASINDLKHAVESLHALFAQANQEMVHDYHATNLKEHFKIISQQNEHIAEGIVSVANLLAQQMAPPQTPVAPAYGQPASLPDFPTPPGMPQQPTQQMAPPPMPPPTSVTPDPTSVLPDNSGLIAGQKGFSGSRAALEAQQSMGGYTPQQPLTPIPAPGALESAQQMVSPIPPPPPKRKGLFK